GARLLEELLLGAFEHESSRDQLRTRDDVAARRVNTEDRQHHAVLREMATVAEHELLDVADAFAVDEDPAGLDAIPWLGAVAVDDERLAVFEQEALSAIEPGLDGELDVAHQVAEFAVHRDEVARTDETEHEAELVLARVPRRVDLAAPRPVDLGAAT